MADTDSGTTLAFASEILALDHILRQRITRALPKGMELSHFSVLNALEHASDGRSPAQLAKALNLTRGAITNTLSRLEWAGYVIISPDWDDARRKHVHINPAGRKARQLALDALSPLITEMTGQAGAETLRAALPVLRDLRIKLAEPTR